MLKTMYMGKNGFNETRILLGRMRSGKYTNPGALIEQSNGKDISMRDLLKRTNRINEEVGLDTDGGTGEQQQPRVNLKNEYDQKREEDKFRSFFENMNVNIQFVPLEVYDDLVFWGGTVDGMIQWLYRVTPDESTSGVEFNYLEDFDRNNPDNQQLIEMIESKYDSFYKYWRDNALDV